MNIKELNDNIIKCSLCAKGEKKSPVWGNFDSKLLFVAEQPGRYRPVLNTEYVPFNIQCSFSDNDAWLERKRDHASGYVLRNVCMHVGIGQNDFVITNIMNCFLQMTPENCSNCFKWLNIVVRSMKNLKLLVCLGKVAGDFFNITNTGKIEELFIGFNAIKVYHPAFVFRKPDMINEYKKQFEVIKNAIA